MEILDMLYEVVATENQEAMDISEFITEANMEYDNAVELIRRKHEKSSKGTIISGDQSDSNHSDR